MRTAPALAAVALLAGPPAAAAESVVAFPSPGDEAASPHTEISFRGTTRGRIGAVRVRGSSSGRHGGRLRRHSDGAGVSFVPDRPFRSGERVRVRTFRSILGTGDGDFSFRIAHVPRRVGPLQIQIPPNTNPDVVDRYRSRRDLAPARVNVSVRRAGTAPGLIFLAPKKGPGQSGPLIVDESGAPVWFKPMPGKIKAADFRVQRYRGERVLTWWQGKILGGEGRGEMVIYDKRYRRVARVRAGNGYAADLHEFEITPEGTALLMIYAPVRRDLRALGGSRRALVTDNIVQEIDISTGRVLFEWHSLDHVGVRDSRFPRPDKRLTPWDYFHANSLTRDADGNLLFNARHTWALYKLHRTEGRIIWQLGGPHSDFPISSDVRFAWQHDARRAADGTITFFDNEAQPPVRDASRALALSVDEQARTVSVQRAIEHPDGLLAASQGNHQTLPNGNVFVGWGSLGAFSEFAPDGRLLLDGRVPRSSDTYRAFKGRWVGRPPRRPAAAASRDGRDVTVWASWNGATEVDRWEVLAGSSRGSLEPVGSESRAGFETRIEVRTGKRLVAVRALDADGRNLRRSRVFEPAS
jgi:hypothetical protein